MLALKLATYRRAASLLTVFLSRCSHAVLAEESLTRLSSNNWVNNRCQRLSLSSCTHHYFWFNNLD